ncbi:MAG: hypothetical protein KDC16_03605 [Saprospiraceae bacterium]|nr:hypothetical protein [Saprospiraceae bacterium]MCB9327428.1 hypothetical protein [Lewinellaceae bacterium]
MKKIMLFLSFSIFLVFACKNEKKENTMQTESHEVESLPENSMEIPEDKTTVVATPNQRTDEKTMVRPQENTARINERTETSRTMANSISDRVIHRFSTQTTLTNDQITQIKSICNVKIDNSATRDEKMKLLRDLSTRIYNEVLTADQKSKVSLETITGERR